MPYPCNLLFPRTPKLVAEGRVCAFAAAVHGEQSQDLCLVAGDVSCACEDARLRLRVVADMRMRIMPTPRISCRPKREVPRGDGLTCVYLASLLNPYCEACLKHGAPEAPGLWRGLDCQGDPGLWNGLLGSWGLGLSNLPTVDVPTSALPKAFFELQPAQCAVRLRPTTCANPNKAFIKKPVNTKYLVPDYQN